MWLLLFATLARLLLLLIMLIVVVVVICLLRFILIILIILIIVVVLVLPMRLFKSFPVSCSVCFLTRGISAIRFNQGCFPCAIVALLPRLLYCCEASVLAKCGCTSC